MMKTGLRLFFLVLIASAISIPSALWADQPASLPAEMATRVDQMQQDMRFFSSDELKGRDVGTDGISQAAQRIADRFDALGLNTQLFEGKPLQPFSVNVGSRVGKTENNRLQLNSTKDGTSQITTTIDADIRPMALGVNAEAKGPVVFVGYGISDEGLQFDEYADVETEGAIVIILRKEPQADDPDSIFNGTDNTRNAFFETKIRNAIRQGAAAVLLVNDQASIKEERIRLRDEITAKQQVGQSIEERLKTIEPERTNNIKSLNSNLERNSEDIARLEKQLQTVKAGLLQVQQAGPRRRWSTVPVMSLSRVVVDQMLKTVGTSLEEVEAGIDSDLKPRSQALPFEADLETEISPARVETYNVVGELPGKGALANETIVVGAHYDHVGMGGAGSLSPGVIAVHNGADDNASGTVTMMDVAAQIVKRTADLPNHRRVVFMAFSAEEKGLLGSKHYVRNPRFPLEDTVLMVNLDMVGRMVDDRVSVYGTGTAEGLKALVDDVNQDFGFKLKHFASGYGPSDHQSFYQGGVPVVFYFTGLHPDYHRPTDDFDKINFSGMTRISDTVCQVVQRVAVRPDRMPLASAKGSIVISQQPPPFLGISMRRENGTVRVSEVVPEGPSAQAKIQVGDELLQVGDKTIADAPDVLSAIEGRSPGQTISLKIRRDGTPQTIDVKLGVRPGE